MKKMFALIEKESLQFAQLPLFEFLGNKSIDLIQRLSFAPCFAFFVMVYGYFNQFVCLEQPAVNPIPDIVNKQIREEENHWIWVLKNLEDLNFNRFLNFTDSLKINLIEQTVIFRQRIYKLYLYRRTFQVNKVWRFNKFRGFKSPLQNFTLLYETLRVACFHEVVRRSSGHRFRLPTSDFFNPIYKLVAIEFIESISNIFLSITAPATQKLKILTNREYPYFGNPDLLAKNDHNIHSHQTKQFIAFPKFKSPATQKPQVC